MSRFQAPPSHVSSTSITTVDDTTSQVSSGSLNINLETLPCNFLQVYPYPAFVLSFTGRRQSEQTQASQEQGGSGESASLPDCAVPIHQVFANDEWNRLSKGRTVVDALSDSDLRLLGTWMCAADAAELRRRGHLPSVDTGQGATNDTELPAEDAPESHAGPSCRMPDLYPSRRSDYRPLTLTFLLSDMNCRFELVCTPIGNDSSTSPSSQRLVVITTTPRGTIVPPPMKQTPPGVSESLGLPPPTPEDEQGKRRRPDNDHDHSNAPADSARTGPELWTEVSQVLANMKGWRPGHALYFHRDGTVNNIMRAVVSNASTQFPVSKLLEEYDFGQTPLGPRANWDLLTAGMVDILMLNPMAATVYLGSELTMVYNQRVADMMPDHPASWGQHGLASWNQLQTLLGPLLEVVMAGIPVLQEDELLMANFSQTESREIYGSQMWLPLRGINGDYGGIFNGIIETTKQVVADRRTNLLKSIAEQTANMHSVDEFYRCAIDALSAHPKDIPFALFFRVEPPSDYSPEFSGLSSNSDTPQNYHECSSLREMPEVQLRYAGGVGVPDGHPAAPAEQRISLRDATELMIAEAFSGLGATDNADSEDSRTRRHEDSPTTPTSSFPFTDSVAEASWPFTEAVRSRKPVHMTDCSKVIEGFPIRVWDSLPKSAFILPVVQNTESSQVAGTALVLGLSAWLPFDAEYDSFIVGKKDIFSSTDSPQHSLRLILASSLIAAEGYEADIRRIENRASLDRTRRLLFSNVFHELCSPLSLIVGPLDDAVAELGSSSTKESLRMAQRNANRLTRLIGMLGDLSTLESGRLSGMFRLTNLGVVTRDLAALFRKTVASLGLWYAIECDTCPRDVYIDREKWEKILFSLIDNAIKHTHNGGVKVTLSYTKNLAVLSVEDISVGTRKVAYPTSSTAGSFSSDISDESDIVLNFTQKLAQLHHGWFEVETKTQLDSADTYGSICRVKIPIGTSHLPPGSIENASEVIPASPRIERTGGASLWSDELKAWENSRERKPNMQGHKHMNSQSVDSNMLMFTPDDVIMVVDDMADSRRYLRSIFEPFCVVVEARDGREALEIWGDRPPNLVIADSHMWRMGGSELLDALKSSSTERSLVPFIMLTPIGFTRHVDDDGFAADEYLSKPFNARDLLSRAHMQLQLGKKRIAMEKAFQERTAELRVLTDLSPVGIFRTNAEGYITYANSAWYEMSGYPRGRVTNWGDYVHEKDKTRIQHRWANYVRSGTTAIDSEFQWAKGGWVATKVIRLDGITDNMTGYIGSVVDITERKLMEELNRQRVVDAEQRRAEAEEAKHQQELLIDIASHEIRNPISSLMQCALLVKFNLQSLLQQLQKCQTSNEFFQPTESLLDTIREDLAALDSIYQCGLTQERISNDVLSLGRIQLNMLQIFDIEVDIVKEAHKIMAMFQSEALIHQITLKMELGQGIEKLNLSHLMLDPVRLGQIITNILSNAMRFTADSPVRIITLFIDVRLDPPNDGTCSPPPWRDGDARIKVEPGTTVYFYASVRDTGPGLTEEEQGKLFQRFSQASAKTHTQFGGSGLGLFVCRKITELMNGQIEVVSKVGQGSEFRFFIKLHTPPTAALPSKTDGAHRRAAATGLEASMKARVLVVEDNLINRTVLIRQLKRVGLEVDSANNGLEALEKIRAAMAVHDHDGQKQDGKQSPPQRFDCVLMDLEMPVMDGYTATRQVRDEEAEGKLELSSIIALTGNARHAMIESAMVDFTDVVVKPYRLDNLLLKINKHRPKRSSC